MILLLMGPPGSGKGTQAAKLSAFFGIPHVSTGDIFRDELARETPLGLKAKAYMEAGELVPDDVVTGMVKERLAKEDCRNGYILDGFPRTIPQAEELEAILRERNGSIDHVVHLDVSEDVIVKRLTGRLKCSACKRDYNAYFNPPRKEGTCDACGAALESRADDNEETIRNRLAVYEAETKPLLSFYGGKVVHIPGGGTPEETFSLIREAVAP